MLVFFLRSTVLYDLYPRALIVSVVLPSIGVCLSHEKNMLIPVSLQSPVSH